MRIPPVLGIGLLGLLFAIAATLWEQRKPSARLRARPRDLLSPMERLMHARLREAFPHRLVLVKVALGALITASLTERARLRHRLADFVVCDETFRVLAVIEFDEGEQVERHVVGESIPELLGAAGYGVREYLRLPSVDELRADWPAVAAAEH